MTDTLLARKFTDAIGAPFLETFRHQYAVAQRPLDLPEFTHSTVGDLHLYHHPDLPVAELAAKDGTRIGWALGYAITPKGHLLTGKVRLALNPSTAADETKLERVLDQLSGRYVVILSYEHQGTHKERLYLDAIGALGAVYDPNSRICASTLLLSLNRDIDPHPVFQISPAIRTVPEFVALLPEAPAKTGIHTTCFGQTFDRHVKQLLTNHCLDLSDFTAHRVDTPEPSEDLSEPTAAAECIIERLRSNMAAMQTSHSGYLAISGGLDSRMLIAAAPEGFGNHMQYYSYSDNWITGIDLRIAGMLAETVGENFLPQRRPDGPGASFFPRPRRSRYFQKRCAVSNGLKSMGDTWWKNGYFRQLKTGSMWLRGNALEVVTARLWTPTVDVLLRKAMRHALRRLGLQTEDAKLMEVMRTEFLAWQDKLPEHGKAVLPDFWYQELFLSHSQAAFHGVNNLVYFPPASDRAIFTAARAVEPGLRRTNVLYNAIIQKARPELAAIPTTRDVTHKLKQSNMTLDDVLPTRASSGTVRQAHQKVF